MKAWFWAFLIILFCAPVVLAGEKNLSLREVLVLAQKDSPEMRAMRDSVLGSKEDVGIARSGLMPKFSFEERFTRTNNPTYSFMAKLNQSRFQMDDLVISSLNHPAAVNDFQTGLYLEQPIYAPRAHVALDMAKKEYEAKDGEFDRKKEDVVFRALKAYLGAQTARQFVRAARRGVDDAREHSRIAKARYDSDTGLYSDMLRVRTALSAAEERLISAEKNLAVAKRAVGLMIGMEEPIDVSEERPELEVRPQEYYYSAALSRKDVRALEVRRHNAENALRMADAGYLPTFGIGGSYQFNSHRNPLGDEGDSWQMSAFLRWEIFDGAKREHERQKAKYAIAESSEHLDGMRKRVSFEVYDAYLGVEEARKSLELARSALEAAEEGGRLVKVRYENSLSTIVDLLDAQSSLDAARADVAGREGAYLAAIANLGFQSGTILKDLDLQQ